MLQPIIELFFIYSFVNFFVRNYYIINIENFQVGCIWAFGICILQPAAGELKFYQGDLRAAECLIVAAEGQAREQRQFDVLHRTLFYAMRIAVSQGNYKKAEVALRNMEKY